MKWEDLVKSVAKSAGAAGVKKLDKALESLEEQVKEPWQKVLVRMTGAAVEKYGPSGLGRIESLLTDMTIGREPDLSFASLKDRSDYLAALQNMEADEKKRARDFVHVIGKQIGVILRAILEGLAG